MDVNFALEDYEVARGFVLACQSYPVTDRVAVDLRSDRLIVPIQYTSGSAWSLLCLATSTATHIAEGALVPHPLFERHAATIERALDRDRRTRLLESVFRIASPKVYGEGAAEAGKAAFDALLGKPFALDQPGTVGTVGRESLALRHSARHHAIPRRTSTRCSRRSARAEREWRRRDRKPGSAFRPRSCSGSTQSFLFANAVMHTTGQAFMMAFQAGGPHAQDRGLEAIAYAWAEMKKIPATALWEKPQGKNEPLRMEKHFRIVPRGIGLVIGCCTFPTWNGFPGFFADLATGNAVVGEAASAGDPAAGAHGAHRARGAGRKRLRPERRHAGRA